MLNNVDLLAKVYANLKRPLRPSYTDNLLEWYILFKTTNITPNTYYLPYQTT